MHAYILVEHQVARATRGRNALEICNFESFIAKQTSTSTDAEVAVASTGLTDSTSGVGVEANATDQLALSPLQGEGSRASDAGVVEHASLVLSVEHVARRTATHPCSVLYRRSARSQVDSDTGSFRVRSRTDRSRKRHPPNIR